MISGNEKQIHLAVASGMLEIDAEGQIWRVKGVRGDNNHDAPCPRHRIDYAFPNGYLRVALMVEGTALTVLAHRLVWFHFYGPIPPGLQINHKNGIKNDNRPENLETVTCRENMQHRREILGVRNEGESHGRSKLLKSQVLEILRRCAAGEVQRRIAEAYGVSYAAVSRIANHEQWACLQRNA